MDDEEVRVWTIYDVTTTDHPGEYVVRGATVTAGGVVPDELFVTAPTLAGVRSMLPEGLTRLPRSPEDDPVILEVWL